MFSIAADVQEHSILIGLRTSVIHFKAIKAVTAKPCSAAVQFTMMSCGTLKMKNEYYESYIAAKPIHSVC